MEDRQPVTQLAPLLRLPQLAPEQLAVERARPDHSLDVLGHERASYGFLDGTE